MPPKTGSRHLRPRLDSGAAELWRWALRRRGAWTCLDITAALPITARRARAFVVALHSAGYLEKVSESYLTHEGRKPTSWRLSPSGRALGAAPVMIVTGNGTIIGFRPAQ